MSASEPTYVGQVASVTGGVIRVRMRTDITSTLIMVDGDSYRVGQVGAFFRLPLGYSQLYAICTQVGADAAPPAMMHAIGSSFAIDDVSSAGFRWMTIVLFGESLGNKFERGVGQYPTIDDEVHIVTTQDLNIIYSSEDEAGTINIGNIAASAGIPARLDLKKLVTRHTSIVGSTGAGKSNLVTTLLESISSGKYPSARILVVDPHGEYGSAWGDTAYVLSLNPEKTSKEKRLLVPYWALPVTALLDICMGGLQPNTEATIREKILDLKKESLANLKTPFPPEAITADSPIPFSIKRLWFELDDFERQTFSATGTGQTAGTKNPLEAPGDADKLISNKYPAASPHNSAPYQNSKKRHIDRQLDFFSNRLRDVRYNFLLNPGESYTPSLDGRTKSDLDELVCDWVGHDRPITVLDVSSIPSEILPTVVGTMVHIVYEALFWAGDLDVSARKQPLLILIEEAHKFIPDKAENPASVVFQKIAKEGRKYGIGLMVVTQRPSGIDSTILSQCGTMIALRTSNPSDRSKVEGAFPDDLGGLADLLPSLRTGEGLFLGEALPIPSRIRIRRARNKPIGDDPKLIEAWSKTPRPDAKQYVEALKSWRTQTLLKPKKD
jgi:uncharacterized protein